MSDIEIESAEEDDQWERIQKADVKPGMFVSGWEDPNDEVDEDQDPHATPERSLLWACNEGDMELAEKILHKHPTAIQATDSDGYSPLHRACYNNNVPLAKLLLTHGANVNAITEFDWTPLHSSCQWMHPECVALLLAHGSNVNAKTRGYQTPLHIAASVSRCRATAVSLLFHPDVQPDMVNNSDETAAELARRSGPTSAIFEMGHSAFQNTIGMID